MRILLTTISFALLASCVSVTAALDKAEINPTFAKITKARASNDIETVILCLPDVEKLWPQQPEIYFRSAKEVAGVLTGAIGKTGSKQALTSMWTNVLDKPLPNDEQKAVTCLELKWQTICLYLNLEEFIGSKSRWVDIAKFIGEIRSRIIPNYKNQGAMISVLSHEPQQLQKLIEENERKKTTDNFQHELRMRNWEFSSVLVEKIPVSFRNDTKFIANVSSAAHFTKEEINRLKEE